MIWMRTKFGQDQKVEFEKSFELECQILLKVLTKVGTNFVHSAWTKVKKMKPRVNIMLKKALFPTKHPNWRNIKWKFADFLPELEYIIQKLGIYYDLLQKTKGKTFNIEVT